METPQAKMHPNKEAFIEGVDLILGRWTALELAVQNEWGGADVHEKRDDMVDEIVEHFDKLVAKRKTPEPTDLQELLLDILETDFQVSLDDGSEAEVARHLCAIFAECKAGNFSTVDKLAEEREARERSGAATSAAGMSRRAEQPQGGSGGSDGSDSSDGSQDGSDSDASMQE
ncbi:rRNA accumulation- protein [Coemansia nantahalensis]|uniref:rRNA accumulation- protein n=1 Tax=Coemansia nantahalensis TaxID=2789366 RepID=A0ACC1JR02_9FUNG|nr:rRNA accumulation- protein [Coemansia nantahalensis]